MSTTTPPKKRGRPSGGEPSASLTPFGRLVTVALAERMRTQAPGPRTGADLARALGCSRQQINGALTGVRPRPTEDQIRAVMPEIP